ncbi:meiosis 1 associated protein, partial [Chelydra serpentina]
ACVKCDIQERLLSPALLPGAADVTVRPDDVNTPYQMAACPATTLYKLRVIKALKAEGVCESALFGLPFIIKPTSCWQLDWDELEMNQHNFHALCHSLLVSACKLRSAWDLPKAGISLGGKSPACSGRAVPRTCS